MKKVCKFCKREIKERIHHCPVQNQTYNIEEDEDSFLEELIDATVAATFIETAIDLVSDIISSSDDDSWSGGGGDFSGGGASGDF